jgi:hypothetical protein
MEGCWIKADRNPNEQLVGDDELECGWLPRDVMAGNMGERRLRTDMYREEAEASARSGGGEWRITGCRGCAGSRETVAFAVEMVTKRVDRDMAPVAKLGLGQTSASEVGDDR